jgi:hypothetical protein
MMPMNCPPPKFERSMLQEYDRGTQANAYQENDQGTQANAYQENDRGTQANAYQENDRETQANAYQERPVLEPANPGQRTPTSPRRATGAKSDENDPPMDLTTPPRKKQDQKVGVIAKLIRSGVYGFILYKGEELFFHKSEVAPEDMVVGLTVNFYLLEDPNHNGALKAVELRRCSREEAHSIPMITQVCTTT